MRAARLRRTVVFCDRFIDRRSPHPRPDGPGGPQRRAEHRRGQQASGTSKKTELKLTSVARASLEELLLDYEDFLRQRGLAPLEQGLARSTAVRKHLKNQSDESDRSDKKKRIDLLNAEPEIAANIMICLINQASYLLRKQLQYLEGKFLEEGGFTERLYSQRQSRRGRS